MIGAGTSTPQPSALNDPKIRAEAARRMQEIVDSLPEQERLEILMHILVTGLVPAVLVAKLREHKICVIDEQPGLPDCPDHEL